MMGLPADFWAKAADDFLYYVQSGGFVMPPLIALAVLLWYGIGYRIAALRMGTGHDVRRLVHYYSTRELPEHTRGLLDDAVVRGIQLAREGRSHLRRHLDDEFAVYDAELTRFNPMITTIVEVAPILGLLGTVVGMIETFDSLQASKLFTQGGGGIAGGISQALFTTQMGLVVALPGLLVNGMLRRKQQVIQRELARIKDLICTEGAIPFAARNEP
jgi:biopolymer transport protein ExbB